MKPLQVAAIALGTVAAAGLGVVVGDLLVDDPAPGLPAERVAIESADASGAAAAQQPSLSVVSIGGETDAGTPDTDDGNGSSSSGGASATSGGPTLTPADLVDGGIDVEAFAAFDEAAETGEDLPDLPTGPAVEDLDEAYAPLPSDEGTVDDPRPVPLPGDDATGEGADTGEVTPPGERPMGAPALDPDLYDVDLPPVIGFDDPCAIGSPAGCPLGVPAIVLGDDPTVPLRLGSVGVLGTVASHGGVCADTWAELGSSTDRVGLAITTNQAVEVQLDLDGTGATLVTRSEPDDVTLAQFIADARSGGRIPSEGSGAVVTCAVAPAASVETGRIRGKARVTADEQSDTLGFDLRVASRDRSRPITVQRDRGLPVPGGSSGFSLTVPQHDPAAELVVVGLMPQDAPRPGAPGCAAFDDQLAEVRATGVSGRAPDDGRAALPVGLTLAADDGTRLSPRGTLPVSADVPDGYNATFRGYAPEGTELLLCAWWFDLEPDGDRHRMTDAAPNDTAMVVVRAPRDIAPGVWVTGIDIPEDRRPGHYNLYLVKPGFAAICLPRNRPDPFPTSSAGLVPVTRASIAERSSDASTTDDAATADDAATPPAPADDGTATETIEESADAAPSDEERRETATAVPTIPAGRYQFSSDEAVRICVPRALANFAVPMVKAGGRPYLPGAPPVPLGVNVPLVPDGLEPPEVTKTFPVVARDGAVLDLTIVPESQFASGPDWPMGREEPQPPATVRSQVEIVGEPSLSVGPDPGMAVLTVRFSENVDVLARLAQPTADDPDAPCTTVSAPTERSSPNGPDHEVVFDGLCAGAAYAVSVDATNAEGTTTTFDVGSHRVPPNAGFFDVAVEVTGVPDGGTALAVADVQFLRIPGIVSLGTRARADDLLDGCLQVGDADGDETVLTSFGEQARLRVRVEGSGCEDGPSIRLDSTLELSAADLLAGPVVFDVSHPAGLTLRVTVTPRTR